jgi:hypothetical protein
LTVAGETHAFHGEQNGGLNDSCFFGERGEREEQGDGDLAAVCVCGVRRGRLPAGRGQIDGEGPEGEGGSEDVGVGERALSEPDGVNGDEEGEAESG